MHDLNNLIKRRAAKLKKIKRVEYPRAIAAALNKTGRAAKTPVIRKTAKAARVPQKHIRKRTFVSRATSRKQVTKITGYVRPLAVVKLLKTATLIKNVRRGTNRRGVRVAGRQYDGAFINVAPNGHFGVFRRKSKSRYPLESITITFDKTYEMHLQKESKEKMKTHFPRLVLHELRFRTRKYTK